MKFIFNLIFSLFIIKCIHSWKPMGSHIKTKWAKEVDPSNVWPEYPRPQLVRQDWINLNGLWEYSITSDSDGEPKRYEGQILVPFPIESSLSGVMRALTPSEALWYRRQFNASVGSDERLLLNFGAVDYECVVYVNGQTVGAHKGGYNRFSFDITEHLNVSDGDNRLVVQVIDRTGGPQPKGKQSLKPGGIIYTSTSGIWQTVWLERVPKTYVKALIITPDVDRESVNITVQTNGQLDNIAVEIRHKNGTIVSSDDKALVNDVNILSIPSPRLWSTVDPYLYDIHITAGNDSVDSYVGLRKMVVRKDSDGINRFFLNDKPVFMFGPLDQGFWPDGIYTAPNEEAMVNDFLITRAIGFNAIRKHIKIESDRWYYTADRLGFLVWQDFPAAEGQVTKETRAPADAAQIEFEMQTMVEQLSHFVSIVMWVPFNEGWGQYDTRRIVGLFKAWDPTRLVNEASGWNDHKVSNIKDMHSYPTSVEIPLEEDRVVVNGEFGGGGLALTEHLWDSKNLVGYAMFNNTKELQKFFVDRLATVRAHAVFGLGAAIYTQTTDVEHEVNGVFTYDRAMAKVDSVEDVAKEVAKLYPSERVANVIIPSGHFNDSQQWFYTTEAPADNWTLIDYNSDDWSQGMSGFGVKGTQDLTARTLWNTSDIWLRKTFDIPAQKHPKHPILHIFYDDIADVYINGHQIYADSLQPFQTSYSALDIDVQALHVGANVIAIHCRQITGGQGVDAGIYDITYDD